MTADINANAKKMSLPRTPFPGVNSRGNSKNEKGNETQPPTANNAAFLDQVESSVPTPPVRNAPQKKSSPASSFVLPPTPTRRLGCITCPQTQSN